MHKPLTIKFTRRCRQKPNKLRKEIIGSGNTRRKLEICLAAWLDKLLIDLDMLA
jgi:hypothetical protein